MIIIESLNLILFYSLKIAMKFTFSKDFRVDIYNQFLIDLGALLEEQRAALGCSVRSTMAKLHVGYPVLKKY